MQLNDSEWKVMRVVWNHHPARARDVLVELEDSTGWAYSTVKTLLTRLVDKGALRESKRANASLYEPRVTEREARQTAVTGLLERAFDGTVGGLVHHLIDARSLNKRDREELRRLLEEDDA